MRNKHKYKFFLSCQHDFLLHKDAEINPHSLRKLIKKLVQIFFEWSNLQLDENMTLVLRSRLGSDRFRDLTLAPAPASSVKGTFWIFSNCYAQSPQKSPIFCWL